MASKTVYLTSKEVSCPVCSKTMLLKNWKDHCNTKHPLILSEESLKNEYEKLKKSAVSSSSSFKTATAVSSTNTLFSMKHFLLTKHSSTTSTFNDNNIINNIIDDNNINFSTVQHLDSNLTINTSSTTDRQTTLLDQIQNLNTKSMIETFSLLYSDILLINIFLAIDYETNNQDVCLLTPTVMNVLQEPDADTRSPPRKQ